MFKPCFSMTYYAHSCKKCMMPEKSRHYGCKKCIDFLNDVNTCGSPFYRRTNYTLSQNKELENEKISHKKKNESEQSISLELSDSEMKSFDDLLKFYMSIASLKTNKICLSCYKFIDMINFCSCCYKFDNSFPKYYKLTLKSKEKTIDENLTDILKKVIFGSTAERCTCEDTLKWKKVYHLCLKDEKTNKNISQFPAHESLNRKPGKGTLKHKRWCMNQLKTESSDDDLYDNTHYPNCIHLLANDFDPNYQYRNAATPKVSFCLSPRSSSTSSRYEDCYDIEEYIASRKRSEQFQYRLRKKRKKTSTNKESENPLKRSSSKRNTLKTLQSAAKILEKLESACKDTDSEESNSDDY